MIRERVLKPTFAWFMLMALLGVGLSKESWGHGVWEELILGKVAPTPFFPSRTFLSNRLMGTVDPSERLSLHLETLYSRYEPTSQTSSANVFQLGLGGNFYPNIHFTLGMDAFLAFPSSTTTSFPVVYNFRTSTMPPQVVPVTGDAKLAAQTSSYGLAALMGYDTAGDSNGETALDASLSATAYDETQKVASVQGPRGKITNPHTPNVCGSAPCGAPIRRIFRKDTTSLLQLRGTLGVTESLYQDTDLGLVGSYYIYTSDPTQVGYYQIPIFGRTSVGEGIPVAPLSYTLRPNLLHQFGALIVSTAFQYGRYVADEGHQLLGLGKVQYKFSKSVKTWVSASLQRDTDGAGTSWNTYTLGLGARLLFE